MGKGIEAITKVTLRLAVCKMDGRKKVGMKRVNDLRGGRSVEGAGRWRVEGGEKRETQRKRGKKERGSRIHIG